MPIWRRNPPVPSGEAPSKPCPLMIEQKIESPRPFPWSAIVLGVTGAGLVVLALATGIAHWAIAAVFPFLAALLLWWARRPAFTMELADKNIEVSSHGLAIAYDTLQGLLALGVDNPPPSTGKRYFPIVLLHEKGSLLIPRQVNVPSADIYLFLYEQFTAGGSRDVNPLLDEYVQRQEQAWGEKAVQTYRAREHLGRVDHPSARAFFLALLLAGLAWIAAGAAHKEWHAWLGTGVFALIFGGLFYLGFCLEKYRRVTSIRNWRNASLAISPEGLAMVQGEIKGELRWDEVQSVRANKKPLGGFRLSSATPGPAIVLKVQGATIHIADIYDRPLALIHETLLAHYEGNER
jgi:hypothetical protein